MEMLKFIVVFTLVVVFFIAVYLGIAILSNVLFHKIYRNKFEQFTRLQNEIINSGKEQVIRKSIKYLTILVFFTVLLTSKGEINIYSMVIMGIVMGFVSPIILTIIQTNLFSQRLDYASERINMQILTAGLSICCDAFVGKHDLTEMRNWEGSMKHMNKMVSYIIIFILSLVTFDCLFQSSNYKSQNRDFAIETQQLKDEIVQLAKSVNEYKTKELRQNELVIQYRSEIPDKVRFIEKENILLALPQEDSKVFRHIQTNTLAKVIDRAFVDDLTWIYIEIPVYDSLTNFRGWIKENDTVLYTKDKVQLVQSDVAIIAGAEVYKTRNFEDIKKEIPLKLVAEDGGRLEEKYSGYCRISLAGGRDVWVKESSVMYPGMK